MGGLGAGDLNPLGAINGGTGIGGAGMGCGIGPAMLLEHIGPVPSLARWISNGGKSNIEDFQQHLMYQQQRQHQQFQYNAYYSAQPPPSNAIAEVVIWFYGTDYF